MRSLRTRLSYANVMSSIAVFMVLGGSAYAASALPKNSVGSKQIKSNAVSSSKVKDGSLLSKDFKAGQLPAGAAGPAGPAGPVGPAGPKGADGANGANGATSVHVRRVDVPLPASGSASAVATCLPGERATGGGVNPGGVTSQASLIKSYPSTGGIAQAADGDVPTAWGGFAQNPTAGAGTLFVFVICAAP